MSSNTEAGETRGLDGTSILIILIGIITVLVIVTRLNPIYYTVKRIEANQQPCQQAKQPQEGKSEWTK